MVKKKTSLEDKAVIAKKATNAKLNTWYNPDPIINSKGIKHGLAIMSMGLVDLGNPSAVAQRIQDWLIQCDKDKVRPLVSDLALAVGMSRGVLHRTISGENEVCNGYKINPKTRDLLAQSYAFLESQIEMNLTEEKASPVKWIFYLKNNFGWADQRETVIMRKDETEKNASAQDIIAKYTNQD